MVNRQFFSSNEISSEVVTFALDVVSATLLRTANPIFEMNIQNASRVSYLASEDRSGRPLMRSGDTLHVRKSDFPQRLRNPLACGPYRLHQFFREAIWPRCRFELAGKSLDYFPAPAYVPKATILPKRIPRFHQSDSFKDVPGRIAQT